MPPVLRKQARNFYPDLLAYSQSRNFTLLEDYSEVHITRDTKISGTCATPGCLGRWKKSYRALQKLAGPLCPICVSGASGKGRASWGGLLKFIEENQIELKYDYSKENFAYKTRLEGKCKTDGCLNFFSTNYKDLVVNNNPYCQMCRKVNMRVKTEETNMARYGVKVPVLNAEIHAKMVETNRKKYGVDYTVQNPEIQKKAIETNREKRGVDYVFQDPEVKAKISAHSMATRGVAWVSQDPEIKKKIMETNLEKYGTEYPTQNEEVKQKTKATNLERYGAESIFQTEYGKEKTKKTNLERYGVEYAVQNPEILQRVLKSRYKFKKYILPSGAIVEYQGYENYTWDLLLKTYSEEQIFWGSKVIAIPWMDSEGGFHYYYADHFIPSEWLLVETKSDYTFRVDKEKIFAKKEACKEAGFRHIIYVFSRYGELLETVE